MRWKPVAIVAIALLTLMSGIIYKTNVKQLRADISYPILMYHHFVPASECAEGTPNYGNNAVIALENFEQQMKYLHEIGANTLLMSELYQYLSQGSLPPKGSIVITFDDGYASNYIHAFPILKKYQLKANIAVMVKASEDGDGGNAHLPHLNFDQMREMAESGLVEFGSHTYDAHGQVQIDSKGKTGPALINRVFNDKDIESEEEYLERIRNELTKSKKILEKQLGQEVIFFSYPFGRYNETLLNEVSNAGYKLAVTTRRAYAQAKDDNLLLPRINVDQNITLNSFAKLIHQIKQ